MAQGDAACLAIELQHHERQLVLQVGLAVVLLAQLLQGHGAFHPVWQGHGEGVARAGNEGTLMDAAHLEGVGKDFPGVLLHLFVAQAEAAVFLVHFQDLHFHLVTDLAEVAGVLHALGPAEVTDVHQAVHAFLQFHEYAEVGEVAHLGSVAGVDGVLELDVLPGVGGELLHA